MRGTAHAIQESTRYNTPSLQQVLLVCQCLSVMSELQNACTLLSPSPGEQPASRNARIARKKVHQRPTDSANTSLAQKHRRPCCAYKKTQQESLAQSKVHQRREQCNGNVFSRDMPPIPPCCEASRSEGGWVSWERPTGGHDACVLMKESLAHLCDNEDREQ